jgi:hypothetical protein
MVHRGWLSLLACSREFCAGKTSLWHVAVNFVQEKQHSISMLTRAALLEDRIGMLYMFIVQFV